MVVEDASDVDVVVLDCVLCKLKKVWSRFGQEGSTRRHWLNQRFGDDDKGDADVFGGS